MKWCRGCAEQLIPMCIAIATARLFLWAVFWNTPTKYDYLKWLLSSHSHHIIYWWLTTLHSKARWQRRGFYLKSLLGVNKYVIYWFFSLLLLLHSQMNGQEESRHCRCYFTIIHSHWSIECWKWVFLSQISALLCSCSVRFSLCVSVTANE